MMIEQKIKIYAKRKNRLENELKGGDLEKVVGDITKIIQVHNLDMTPTVLSDLLDHIEETIALQRSFKV